ncbi:hypothetical protein HYPSUDRAFT_51655 [Hypholoma sublateritium FD-334 SS-4]|uniref:Uncharacterized protein n=1 Tax=Hypholoma sublateritium (strain FD-334 SS-4) TaxID=945553 RepID=A0A0D2P9K7_HYPSF|nr:hypothetical protein HYPSUDRAFT_51655 [Hypholoma sublateritium FD-334 SS-4]
METLVTFSVDDTSPAVTYSPFRDTFSTPNLIGGWNPYFSNSGFATSQGAVGVGTSLHITSLDGAALQIQWQGTGITLMGNATQANYSITLDGQLLSSPTTADNVLADIQSLNDTLHTVQLTAQISQSQNPPNSSMLVFDQAILFSSPLSVANNMTFQNQTIDDQDINFRGRWSIASPNAGVEFHTTTTVGDVAMTTFNGTTFLVLGQTSPNSGNYSVQLDNTTTQFNARSSFTQSDSLLFFATDLDPTVLHTVTINNTDGSDLSLLIDGFKSIVESPSTSTAAPTSSATAQPVTVSGVGASAFSEGTIAAFALAGILAFILISGILFFFLVYRPRRRRRQRVWAGALGDKHPPSPKEEEAAAGVLDIAPTGFDDGSDEGGDEAGSGHSPKGPAPRRWSALSGFQRWRREAVRGSLGGMSLGIRFRHSDSAPARSPVSNADSGRPSSAPTSLPSSTESAKRARAKRKGKARHVSGMSWTPSFTLDLPMPRPRWSQQRQLSTVPQEADPGVSGGGRVISLDDILPELPSRRSLAAQLGLEPPSYAASVSPHNSLNGSHSSPSSLIPSGPRSVSENSPAAHHIALAGAEAFARPHQYGGRSNEETHAFLLHEGTPETGISGGVSTTPVGAAQHVVATSPTRPLPSTTQFQLRARAPTPPAGDVLAFAAVTPTHNLSRKIIAPHLIDTSLEATATDLDDPSIEEPHIMREVLRGLSPRTSRALPIPPPPPRRSIMPAPHALIIESAGVRAPQNADTVLSSPESAASPTRRLLPQPDANARSSRWFSDVLRSPPKPLPRTPSSDDEDSALAEVRDSTFLDVRETSPFRIDFGGASTATSLRALPPSGGGSSSDDAPSHAGGASSDGSVSEPTFYTTAAEDNYKPARNTFGAASTVLERIPSTSDRSVGSGGPLFRASEFVQGSSRLPFRLTSVSFQAPPPTPTDDPSPATSDGVTSFLDFTNSRQSSLSVPSEKSKKNKRARELPAPPVQLELRSRWSNTTVPSVATGPPEAGAGPTGSGAHESTGESAGESQALVAPRASLGTGASPVSMRLSIPPSPYLAAEGGALSHSQRSSSNAPTGESLHVHPVLEDFESPTDSLPISTSEIRFRHPSDSEEGHQARRGLPLPDLRRPNRSSMPDMAEEYRPRPFDPSVLVNRVLGLSSPTSSTTPRPNHSRTQSNLAISSTRTSPFPASPRHDSSNEQLSNNRPGQS